MLFLTIPSTNGETLTINPNQIIFVGDFGNGECWIQLPKSTIRISEDIYTDILRHLDRVVIDTKNNKTPKDLKCENESSKGIKSFVCKSLQKIITKLEQFNTKLKGE